MVILDTCSLINLCLPKPPLSNESIRIIDSGASILSISFAEIGCKIKAGKLDIGMSSEQLLSHYRMMPKVEIIDITPELWHKSISLEWSNKDPADRLIVAYAIEFGLDIVTSDKLIKKFYKKVIW